MLELHSHRIQFSPYEWALGIYFTSFPGLRATVIRVQWSNIWMPDLMNASMLPGDNMIEYIKPGKLGCACAIYSPHYFQRNL